MKKVIIIVDRRYHVNIHAMVPAVTCLFVVIIVLMFKSCSGWRVTWPRPLEAFLWIHSSGRLLAGLGWGHRPLCSSHRNLVPALTRGCARYVWICVICSQLPPNALFTYYMNGPFFGGSRWILINLKSPFYFWIVSFNYSAYSFLCVLCYCMFQLK